MADILIRDVPENVLAGLDSRASKLGLSRSEYIRRQLAQDAARVDSSVSVGDLQAFGSTFSDLNEPDVMTQAWQ